MVRLSLAALACAVVLTGCGESLEGNPLFKEQQKTVARLDSETKSMGRQFEDVAITVSNLRQQVREMRNDPSFVPASNSSSGDLEATLRDLQARVAALEAQLGKSKSGANLASAAPAPAPAKSSSSTADSGSGVASGSSSSEARQTVRVSTRPAESAAVAVSLSRSEERDEPAIEVAAAVAKAPAAAPAAPRPAPRQEARASGSYYQVREGDTPASVAREHGISQEKLSGANGIPPGRSWRLMPGQRIFVPKG